MKAVDLTCSPVIPIIFMSSLNPKAHWMAGFGPYGKRQAICKKS
jgi:hypothetical protein